MLVSSPKAVRYADLFLENVESIVVERSAHRIIEEWADGGAHAVFVDVPQQRTSVKLVRRLAPGEQPEPRFVPGLSGVLGFFDGPGGSDASLTEVNIRCVLTGVRYETFAEPTRQVLTMLAVAESADADPVVVLTGTRIAAA